MEAEPIWLTEAEVVSLVDMGEAIQAVEHGLESETAGSARSLLKTHQELPGGGVHSLGGALLADDLVGVKSWAHTPGGANPLLTLWRISDGTLLAVIEAFALGQYRTAAVAGAATHALARVDASKLAMVGAGHQALTQVAAVAAVRPLTQVSVWSRSEDRRQHFADAVSNALGLETSSAETVEEACADADIVTLVSRATAPIVSADAVPFGSHINAMGAITPERAEFDPKMLERCGVVVADSVGQARALSQEFGEFYGDDDGAWDAVLPLSAVAGPELHRPADVDLTLFKSMGIGLADVAIGLFVYEQAITNRIGTPLSTPARSRPRLRSNLRRPGVGYV